MKDYKKPLPKKNNGNKPVQEDLPSSQQKPMGDENDLEKNNKQLKDKLDDDKDTNSVGIRK